MNFLKTNREMIVLVVVITAMFGMAASIGLGMRGGF